MLIPEMAQIAALLRSLHVDQDVIDRLQQVLDDNAEGLRTAPINRLAMTPHAFGGSAKAAELGVHHRLAQSVIADTIVGVAADLARFRDGVENAVKLLETADGTSQADLARKTQAVASLTAASGWSEGDHNYDRARNHLDVPADPPADAQAEPPAAPPAGPGSPSGAQGEG